MADGLTVMVCVGDPLESRALEAMANEQGFQSVAGAATGPEALQAMPFLRPSLLLIVDELSGMTGLETARATLELDPRPEVLLLSHDPAALPTRPGDPVFATIGRGDRDALVDALGRVRHWLVTGERRTGEDRRKGDRRKVQDWSKVTRERRSGVDRREGPRRGDGGA
jgi:CheY-like chemotaxis protein